MEGMDANIRERQRENILQILAYSTLFNRRKVVACLAYPCHRRTWERMRRCRQLHQHATVYSGVRQVDLVLTAVPIVAGVEEIVGELVRIFGGGD